MVEIRDDLPLGETIRRVRQSDGARMTGRELARRLEITPSYLTDIELGRRTPSEVLMHRIAKVLSLDFDTLMARSGRLGDVAERYLRRTPDAGRLLRRIADQNLTASQVRDLIDAVDRLGGGRRPREIGPPTQVRA